MFLQLCAIIQNLVTRLATLQFMSISISKKCDMLGGMCGMECCYQVINLEVNTCIDAATSKPMRLLPVWSGYLRAVTRLGGVFSCFTLTTWVYKAIM